MASSFINFPVETRPSLLLRVRHRASLVKSDEISISRLAAPGRESHGCRIGFGISLLAVLQERSNEVIAVNPAAYVPHDRCNFFEGLHIRLCYAVAHSRFEISHAGLRAGEISTSFNISIVLGRVVNSQPAATTGGGLQQFDQS
ncbi:hypothetical protein [Mesorhizobium caraganae]|uniref:hypothetical protein n=1 Tax=Mesorhizobium caraganae TaxID=483206 RepID=UPI00177B1960|nr:hypothetical protein [Mesorhizobium caraganae]